MCFSDAEGRHVCETSLGRSKRTGHVISAGAVWRSQTLEGTEECIRTSLCSPGCRLQALGFSTVSVSLYSVSLARPQTRHPSCLSVCVGNREAACIRVRTNVRERDKSLWGCSAKCRTRLCVCVCVCVGGVWVCGCVCVCIQPILSKVLGGVCVARWCDLHHSVPVTRVCL